MTPDYKEYLRRYINDYAIMRVPNGCAMKGAIDNTWYSWQFYLRRAIFDPMCSYIISSWLTESHDEKFQYAAMETAGPPILSAFQSNALLSKNITVKGFAIRKDQKKYGTLNWIEGYPDLTFPTIILDDLANSKSTITRAKSICEAHGITVASAKTIVNKSADLNHVDGLPVDSIFTLSDFDLSWDAYYKNKPEPDKLEFVERYKNILYLNVKNKGYVRANEPH